jgi:hypothetical protein
VGLEEDGRGPTDNGAEAEVGVHELMSDEVEAVEGGRGAGGRWVGERLSVGGDVLEREEGVREMVEGVRYAGGTGFGDKADKTKDQDKRPRQKTKTKDQDKRPDKRPRQKTKTKYQGKDNYKGKQDREEKKRPRQKTKIKDKDKRPRQKTKTKDQDKRQ